MRFDQKLAEDDPKSPDQREGLANGHCELSHALRSVGRPAEAKSGYDRAISLLEELVKDGPTRTFSRSLLAASLLGRGLARRDLGDPAGAAADTRRALSLFEALPSRAGEEMFYTACCHAALAGLAGNEASGVPAAEPKTQAEQAMAMLRKTIDLGYRNALAFRNESALDPLAQAGRLQEAAPGAGETIARQAAEADMTEGNAVMIDVRFSIGPAARPNSGPVDSRKRTPR